MIASRIGRAATRFGPTRFGGSNSAMIGSAIAHNSSGTRQIAGNGFHSFLFLAILHLRLSRRCSPYASLEIVTKWRTTIDQLKGRRRRYTPSTVLPCHLPAGRVRSRRSPDAAPDPAVI